MKIKSTVITAAILASLGFSSASFAKDGTINFTGEVLSTACTISPSSVTLPVDLGKVAAKAFASAGSTAAATRFNIAVTACPDNTQASVRFDGNPDAANNELLAVTSGSTAKGVGIGIYEADSSTLIPMQSDSAIQVLTGTSGNFSYVAKMVSTTASVTAGTVAATTDFTITYQ